MLVVTITQKNHKKMLSKNIPRDVLLEIRLDTFNYDREIVKKILSVFSAYQFIFTCRDAHGVTLDLFYKLLDLNPKYIDLEYDVDSSFFEKIKNIYPQIEIICSYHNFKTTPDLEDVFYKMKQKKTPLYKIATTANNCIDAMRVLLFLKSKKANNLACMAMGDFGYITRILSKCQNSYFTYAYLDEAAINGQVSVDELINRYSYNNQNEKTKIYVLLGSPVDKSMSHITHNEIFLKNGLNCIYLKIKIKAYEIKEFLCLAKEIGFSGFSITMPYKNHVCRYVKSDLDCVNTVFLKSNTWHGYNSDGKGAIKALLQKSSITDKIIVVLGAGGTARAIIKELLLHNPGDIFVINRTEQKARALEDLFDISVIDEGKLKDINYDILINATCCGMLGVNQKMPINKKHIKKDVVVLDVVYNPMTTEFIKESTKKGCQIVFGYEMFCYQALEQFKIWELDIDQKKAKRVVEKVVLDGGSYSATSATATSALA
jgi:3-dehydroquinate dehydratase / shikimate dehydrogenase